MAQFDFPGPQTSVEVMTKLVAASLILVVAPPAPAREPTQGAVEGAALLQLQGVDLPGAPRQRSKGHVIREFLYPRGFEVSEILDGLGEGVGFFPVDRTSQTALELSDTNITPEVEAALALGPDCYTVDLTLISGEFDLEGLVDYGAPILIGATESCLSALVGLSWEEHRTAITIWDSLRRTLSTTVTIRDSWGKPAFRLWGDVMRDENTAPLPRNVPIVNDVPFSERLFRRGSVVGAQKPALAAEHGSTTPFGQQASGEGSTNVPGPAFASPDGTGASPFSPRPFPNTTPDARSMNPSTRQLPSCTAFELLPGGGGTLLTWSSLPGRRLVIENSGDLITWTAVGPAREITPGVFQVTDANAEGSMSRFYRAVVP